MSIKMTDNSDIFINAAEMAVQRALEAIGLTAEKHAKEKCVVDTGRLRNSITHATKSNHDAHEFRWSNSKRGGQKAGNGITEPHNVPRAGRVYIGTNVEYAPDIEFGTSRQKPKPFIRPAISEYKDEYKRLTVKYLKGE